MATRTETENTLFRLANYIECQLADILRDLIIESRTEAASDVAWSGCNFIDKLREASNGAEGGAE